jgi:hypothetical protein
MGSVIINKYIPNFSIIIKTFNRRSAFGCMSAQLCLVAYFGPKRCKVFGPLFFTRTFPAETSDTKIQHISISKIFVTSFLLKVLFKIIAILKQVLFLTENQRFNR